MSYKTDYMIDLEFLSFKENGVILSIGCVEFDIVTGRINREFYRELELKSQIDLGRVVSPDNVMWWIKLGTGNSSFSGDTKDTKEVLESLSEFIRNGNKVNQGRVWAKGVIQDITKLENIYSDYKLEVPWNYRDICCMRALINLNPTLEREFNLNNKNNNQHNALQDCIYQVDLLMYLLAGE